jgi:hypothetical protein
MQNTEQSEIQKETISKLEKHLPNSSPTYPNFVLFSYSAHLLINETEKLLNEYQEGDTEMDMEKQKLFVLRTRQCLDKVVPDLEQFHYSTQKE